MDLFKKPLTVTGVRSFSGFNNKVAICLIILFVGILVPVRADLQDTAIKAVSEILDETRNASAYISALAKGNVGSIAESQALNDCSAAFQDALSRITKALSQLENLNLTNFVTELGNALQILSGVVTDLTKCLGGFSSAPGAVKVQVEKTVKRVDGVLANAVVAVNRYANAGPRV